MKRTDSQAIKITLAAFAVAMMMCAARPFAFVQAIPVASPAPTIRNQADTDNSNLILFRREPINTRACADLDTAADDLRLRSNVMTSLSGSSGKQLRVIQFAGPIKREWIERLKATGAEIIGYVPNNAYIIRGAAPQLARVAALDAGLDANDARPIKWMGRLQSIQKIDPVYDDSLLARAGATIDVEIELLDSYEAAQAIDFIKAVALKINRAPRRFLKFVVLSVTIPVERLVDIADFDEVLFASPAPVLKLHDESSAQIAAGNLTANLEQPTGPGYLGWLASKGLDARTDFAIDFTDSGLDSGSTSPLLVHPDFLDAAGQSRVAYSINYTKEDRPDDRSGHGTLVASVACGAGLSGRTDAAGYLFGLGVEPHAIFGASRIFSEGGALPFQLSFTKVASSAYEVGARISNNSWGNGGNAYDATAQEYDALARDAQPAASGNQEMVFVFSAGNNGAGGHISSPGTAKNVITVGASENFRPEGSDSCNLDGGGSIGPDGADSALDILRFSSGGPTSDGRAKPDIAAPGTHVFGAASQSHFFNGGGLCPGITRYQPPGQDLYTWSSGTSLAAPHVSGAAALARKFFVSRDLLGGSRAPSPAMTKAYLINSATYMTGAGAGGDLPGDRQGWGLLDLGRAFDDSTRKLIDQTRVFTDSGQTFEIQGSLADRASPLRVTLTWTDAPGMLAGAALVNDLDLEITVGGATIYRGNNFAGEISAQQGEPDRFNNVESIFLSAELIPAGIEGNFTITVRAVNIAGDGVPGNEAEMDQDFALVITNIAEPVKMPPPKIIPAITAASYIKKRLTITGRDFTRAALVEINGKIIERNFAFDAATNSLSAKTKTRKLNLSEGSDNKIVLIENGERSAPFILRL